MSKYLYGSNGSKYAKVKHIPHELDSKGNVYFKQDGNFYYNTDGATYRMNERSGDSWNGRLRARYNVSLQRKNWGKR